MSIIKKLFSISVSVLIGGCRHIPMRNRVLLLQEPGALRSFRIHQGTRHWQSADCDRQSPVKMGLLEKSI